MDNNRRNFLRKAAITTGAVTSLSGCVFGGEDNSGQTGGKANDFTLSGTLPDVMELNRMLGIRQIAAERNDGWDVAIEQAGSSNIVVQTMISGQTMGGSIGGFSAFPIIEQGRPIKAVGGFTGAGDYVLVAQPDITSFEDIVEQDALIGMNAPTGIEVLLIMGVLLEQGAINSINDLNLQQIGFSSARVSALLSGDIDVSAQHYNQWLAMKEENPDLNMLGVFQDELDQWLGQLFWTTPKILDEYEDEWVAILESVALASRQLYDGFETFKKAARQYLPAGSLPDSDSQLEQIYDFNTKYEVWPRNLDMTEATQDFGLELAASAEITNSTLARSDVFDRSALDKALDNVDRV